MFSRVDFSKEWCGFQSTILELTGRVDRFSEVTSCFHPDLRTFLVKTKEILAMGHPAAPRRGVIPCGSSLKTV
jgi:hypothetical protein